MSAQEAVKQNIGRMHHKLNSSPLLSFLLSALVIGIWLAASVVQIQTSEALALGSTSRVAGVSWGTLGQFVLLVTGQAPTGLATAWIYAWVVEIVTLVFAINLSVAVAKIASVNPHISKGFVFCGAALIILNSYADYSSSPGATPLMQILIALAIGGIAVVGLPLGVGLFEHGIEEF